MAKRGKEKEAVAIAKDVLAQLKAKKYIASSGVYLGEGSNRYSFPFANYPAGDLRRIIKKHKRPCAVCALGSMFLSVVRKDDKFDTKPLTFWNDNSWSESQDPKKSEEIGSGEMRQRLMEVFTWVGLLNIEHLFEGDYSLTGLSSDQSDDLSVLDDLSDKDKLVFLMNQIIAQKGKFNVRKVAEAAQNV